MRSKYFPLLLILALLAILSGYLTSKISFVGRIGVNTFYDEYAFFKSWWQSALVFFVLQLIWLFIAQKLTSSKGLLGKVLMVLLIVVACAGAYYTYLDFRKNLAHRLLGERFHIGIYLYWLGMLITCASLFRPKR